MTDRERFEAWRRAHNPFGVGLSTEPGRTEEYDSPFTQQQWVAWQAATAAAEADKWEAVRRCVDVINCYSYVGDRSKEMLVAIKAEFPEAWK